MTTPTTGTEPTQVRRPWRATLRTALAVGLPAIFLLPTILEIVVDELGDSLPPNVTAAIVATGVVITAIAAALTRIMALPSVELLLRRIPGAPFAAQPRPKPTDDSSRSALELDDERFGVHDPGRACARANGMHCSRHNVDHWRSR